MQEELTVRDDSGSEIRFEWNRGTEKPGRTLTMVNGGFLVDGKKTKDLNHVLSAVQDFASYLVEEEPDLVTAEIIDPDAFTLSWELDDVQMMRFEGDGTIFIMGKFMAKDLDAVTRISAWMTLNRRA